VLGSQYEPAAHASFVGRHATQPPLFVSQNAPFGLPAQSASAVHGPVPLLELLLLVVVLPELLELLVVVLPELLLLVVVLPELLLLVVVLPEPPLPPAPPEAPIPPETLEPELLHAAARIAASGTTTRKPAFLGSRSLRTA
jgi:hypothetical protein